MITTVEQLQSEMLETMRENTELKIENKMLRDKFETVEDQYVIDDKSPEDYIDLEKIYQSGFHVCNIYYGMHRPENEDCVFCLDILDQHQNGVKS